MNSFTNVAVAEEVKEISSIDPGLGAYNFDNLGEIVQFADLMAQADVMLPPHLRKKPAVCLAVTMRAIQWKVDPFALAMETYQAKEGGPIGYQAKVFVSALEACAGISLNYTYEGSFEITDKPATSARGNIVAQRAAKGDRRCVAWVEIGGRSFEYVSPRLDEVTVKNSPLWHLDPDQQLAYYASRGWVRRHKPSVMMGAYSADEVESMEPMRDVTPERKSGGFTRIADQARVKQHTDEPAETEAPLEGEVQNEAEPNTQSAAYLNGVTAAEGGLSRSDCPYEDNPEDALEWLAGWDSTLPPEDDDTPETPVDGEIQ